MTVSYLSACLSNVSTTFWFEHGLLNTVSMSLATTTNWLVNEHTACSNCNKLSASFNSILDSISTLNQWKGNVSTSTSRHHENCNFLVQEVRGSLWKFVTGEI